MTTIDFDAGGGLRVRLLDRPHSLAVDVAGAVAAGYRHDPDGRAGTAHLTEHLLAVAHRRAAPLEHLGGSVEATTHVDHMESRVVAPVDEWRRVLAAEVGRLNGEVVASEEVIAAQRDAVSEEVRALRASASPWPALTHVLFDGDAELGHEGFGVESEVARIDGATCLDFAARKVAANRAVLVLAADLDHLGGVAAVRDHIDSVSPDTPRRGEEAGNPVRPGARLRPARAAIDDAPGIDRRWRAWIRPGMRRDMTTHLGTFAVSRVLQNRLGHVRFGRSGPCAAADRDVLAVGHHSPDEIERALTTPTTSLEADLASTAVRRLAIELEHSTVAVARGMLLAPDTDPTAVAGRITVDRALLDGGLADLATSPCAELIPGAGPPRSGGRDASFSHEQSPVAVGPEFPVPARTAPAAHPLAPDRKARSEGPTWIGVRRPEPGTPPPVGWLAGNDLTGSRYLTVADSRRDVARALLALTDHGVTGADATLAALGPHAGHVHTHLADTRPGAPVLGAHRGAAEWLALAVLNSVHRLASGRAPAPRAIRVPGEAGVRLLSGDATGLMKSLDDATDEIIDTTRRFSVGQVLVATADGAKEIDLLLTLTAQGIALGAPGDVAVFADALDRTTADDARAAGHDLVRHSAGLTDLTPTT